MKFTLPKGMRDIAPDEMAKREYALGVIKTALAKYGFQLVEPSTLENLETLTAKSGPDLEKEIYAFEDKGGRKIGLRFDLTVGMARFASAADMPKPLRLACISDMWRYDNPQYARYRSFSQWDVEIYGIAGPEADAEIIALIIDVLRQLRLGAEMRINSRKLIEGFLLGIGVDKAQLMPTLRVIDKTAKLNEKDLMKAFEQCGVGAPHARKILDLCTGKATLEKIEKALPKNDLAKEGLEELKALFSLLETYGVADRCKLDLSIVRGIDYYTGLVYEAWVKDEEDVGAIVGGGRYDDLLALYGKPMPATGFAGGIERLLLSLEKKKLLPERLSTIIVVAYVTPDLFDEAIRITQRARSKGLSAVLDLNRRSLGKQLEYANRINAAHALIVGTKELKDRKLTLRDLKSGEEKKISMDLKELEPQRNDALIAKKI